MNIGIWMLAGGVLGWIGYTYLGYNQNRSVTASVVIGVAGGLFGGRFVAPLFTAAAAAPGDFSASALFFAIAVATAFLFAGNVLDHRWGV